MTQTDPAPEADIVARLRERGDQEWYPEFAILFEAADRIEELQSALRARPPEGEMGELVKWLRWKAEQAASSGRTTDPHETRFAQTADALERLSRRVAELEVERRAFTALLPGVEELEAQRDAALEALRPFAAVGRVIDGPFGPALFADDDDAFQSGCAWTENGERKTLTWGQFRAAHDFIRRALSEAGDG